MTPIRRGVATRFGLRQPSALTDSDVTEWWSEFVKRRDELFAQLAQVRAVYDTSNDSYQGWTTIAKQTGRAA